MTIGPILVFGVSGVGKTSACEAFVSRNPDVLFVSASSLLSAAKRSTPEVLRTASAADIAANQDALAGALAEFRRGRGHRPVLVDAHGVIDNDVGYVRVPLSVIEGLRPEKLVLIEAPAPVVAERRARASRRRPARTVEQIRAEIDAERSAVQHYATELNLNLNIVRSDLGISPEGILDAAIRPADLRSALR